MKRFILLLLLSALCFLAIYVPAEAPLTVQQVFEQIAVPLALANDDGVLVNESFSAKDLDTILQAMLDNGHETDPYLQWLCSIGEGYWEEETLMAICRKAFGGIIDSWDPEQQHWFGEMCIAIRFSSENGWALPGSEGISRVDAISTAIKLLREKTGEETAASLQDETQYRIAALSQLDEDARPAWTVIFYPLTLSAGKYSVAMNAEGSAEWIEYEPSELGEHYNISSAITAVSSLGAPGVYGLDGWSQENWVLFSKLLKNADPSETAYHPDYIAYLSASYPDASTAAVSAGIAYTLATDALGIRLPYLRSTVLTSAVTPVWKFCIEDEKHNTWLAEIDAADGHTVWTSSAKSLENWARWVPHECYDDVMGGVLDEAAAIRRAAEAVRTLTGAGDLPLEDENSFLASCVRQSGKGVWLVRFVSRSMNWGSGQIRLDDVTGEVLNWDLSGMTEPVTGDNLLSRFCNEYGWWGEWDQSVWVKLGDAAKSLNAETEAGCLLAITEFLPEDRAFITKTEAIRIATAADSPSGQANEWNSCVLLGDEGHPIWKLHMLYGDTPGTTLYEIDAITGEILDTQKFITDNPDVNPACMIYTLHKVFARHKLDSDGEEGALWLAQDALTKEFGNLSYDDPTFDLDNSLYTLSVTHENGWTLRWNSVSADVPSYLVILTEDGIPLTVRVESVLKN